MSETPRIARYFAASALVALGALNLPELVGGGLILLWTVGSTFAITQAWAKGRDRKNSALSWAAATTLLLTSGLIVRAIHGAILGSPFPMPSPADLLHFPAYLLIVGFLIKLHRSRSERRNVDAWLDGLALANAISLVSWVAFYGDFLFDESIPSATRLTNAPFDILVLAASVLLMRITASPGSRPHAYYLLGAAIASLAMADYAAGVSLAKGAGLSFTVACSAFASGFTVAAVRHPSIHHIFDEHVSKEFHAGRLRLGLLAASIVSPVTVLLFGRGDSTIDLVVVTVLSSSLALIVTTRVLRMVRSEQESSRLERNLAEEISRLAASEDPKAIRGELAKSATCVLPESAMPSLAGKGAVTAWALTLPDRLRSGGATHLQVANHLPSEREERLLRTLLHNADTITRASETQIRETKLHSEAEANKRIAANERRFRALVQNASDVVAVMGPRGAVSYISESCEKVLGYPPDRFVGDSLEWVAHHNDWDFARDYMQATINGTESRREHEVRAFHRDGSIKLLEYVITDMREVDGIGGLVVNITDVTEKRTLQRNLRDAETTDPLTLLLNRTAFIREADASIRRASVSNNAVAMAIINLDDFRLINEGYGTSIADEVLVELSHRVRQSVRSEDSVARLNGDEFGILMPSGYTDVEAEHVVERILQEVTEPVEVAGRTIALRATAGLVICGDGSATGINMLRDADTALDAAKQTHRGSLVQFNEAMGEEMSERVELRNLLHNAIANDKLRLAFQPIVDIESGLIVSMEALARWHDKERGDIGPSTFIPIAESTGMISELGEWALRTACNHVVEWEANGFDGFTVSVNMSGHQLREENIIAQVRSVLQETGVDPERITIEITESVLIDDTDFIADRISALRDLGLRLAIDDFGTGYSSLSYLRRYEFDVLKIDRSFVIPLADDNNKREREIVNAMIKLAQALGAVTVAEGIEQSEEYAVLRTLGCDYAQGYLFWHPVESDEVIEILDSQIAGNTAA